MPRSLLGVGAKASTCLLSVLLLTFTAASGQAQTTSAQVNLNLVNAADGSVVVQGDDLQVQVTVLADPQNELRSNDKILLLRTNDDTVISQGVRGKLDANGIATVLLGTSGGNALGTLQARYVKQDGTPVPDSSSVVLVVSDPAILELSGQLDAETQERIAADDTLQANLDAEADARAADDATLQSRIETEEAARAAADAAEAGVRLNADQKIRSEIATESANRASGDNALQSQINAEVAARSAEDTALSDAIAAEATAREAADQAEEANRSAGDAALASRIGEEEKVRQQADATERAARQSADAAESGARQSADNAEVGARIAADAFLQSQIGAIVGGRTIVVPGDLSPTENCDELRMVIANLPDLSEDNPYLVRLGPGIFACGNELVGRLRFLTLEGSGVGATVLTTTRGQSRFAIIADAVRHLTVRHLGSDSPGHALSAKRIEHVTVIVEPSSSSTRGINLSGDGTVLRHVRVLIGESGTGVNRGIGIEVNGENFPEITSRFEMVDVVVDLLGSPESEPDAVRVADYAELIATDCRFRGRKSLSRGRAPIRLIGTQLDPPPPIPSSLVRCVGAYDGNFDSLSSSCESLQ
jgi:hypothetical protein